MPDLTEVKVQALLIATVLSIVSIIDLVNRWRNGYAYRQLRQIKHPNEMTKKILQECEPLLKPTWWHWGSCCVFVLSLAGLIIDSH